jgi:GrpB-like predicted nucleotidyltransferase (UPF0157 family)/tRNA U34 5-methylaminomethyl-2-thiouridine-forming methyltransferase MnmC
METPTHLVNEHYQDRYFDVVNAIAEARHVYFEGCQILEHLQQQKGLNIGETGFGAGRVLLSLLCYLSEAVTSGRLVANTFPIVFASVELHPLPVERLASILSMFAGSLPGIDAQIQKVVNAYAHFDLTHTGVWQEQTLETACGPLTLKLWCGEALDMVNAISERDVWFLEGHGPKSNPAIWRTELLHMIGQKTLTGGHCATFTVAGEIRRDLRTAGFNTRRLPGFGGKKEVLQGVKRPPEKAEAPLRLENYLPQWSAAFESIAQILREALHADIVGIEHVGSTSVPGLAAQPVLDIDIVISSSFAFSAVAAKLKTMGYQMEGGACFHYAPEEPSQGRPEGLMTTSHDLRVFSIESATLHQRLLLRDYLRLYADQARAYGELKQAFVQRYPKDHSAYAGAKTRFINQLLAKARKELR